jgi:hypothetical protein
MMMKLKKLHSLKISRNTRPGADSSILTLTFRDDQDGLYACELSKMESLQLHSELKRASVVDIPKV